MPVPSSPCGFKTSIEVATVLLFDLRMFEVDPMHAGP